MASFMYNKAVFEMIGDTLNLDTDALVFMLVNSGYTPNKDDDFVDAGGSDPLSAEIVATNYTGGWGGAGRMPATLSFAEQDANDRAVVKFVDVTWPLLGGAANDTIVAAILIKEGVADDSDSLLIAYFDITDTLTNGGDFTLDADNTNGNIRLNT